jgi:hypothetical protein
MGSAGTGGVFFAVAAATVAVFRFVVGRFFLRRVVVDFLLVDDDDDARLAGAAGFSPMSFRISDDGAMAITTEKVARRYYG